MALLPPKVVGPLSECSSHVRVQGQVTGATVDLFDGGAHVGQGVATWSDEVFALNAGVTLTAGSEVTATQTLGADVSPHSPVGVTVQKKPPTIGHVGCKTHVYQCGQCLWLDGMVPGATVEVRVGASVRGSGRADDGSARIGLTQPTGSGEILEARQVACGTPGAVTPLPPADPLPRPHDQRFLPAPVVASPLRECQRAVTVSSVIDGARVTLTQTMGPTEQSCFDLSSLWFPTPPLTLGETVSARQDFPECKAESLNSAGVVVGPATPVPAPTVEGPLCAGGTVVRLTGLLPGSQVRIFQNATDLGTGEAPDSSFDFEVPPLAGGGTVRAQQELCGHWSALSGGVKVDPQPAQLAKPVVRAPLYACGAAVHVSSLHVGSMVYVYSTDLAAPIGMALATATAIDVSVSPQLIPNDTIYAVEVGCGLTSAHSASVKVHPAVKPPLPKVVPPVESCMRSVTVADCIPGAKVEVYVNGAWRGSSIATAAETEVPILFGALTEGDLVAARQMICEFVTERGKPVTVVASAPYYYTTQHYDRARSGWYPYEKTLTTANVHSVHQLFSHGLDGQSYSQPLYAHHVNVPGKGVHNIVLAATENDSVYAFDADTNQPALWHRSLIPPGHQIVSSGDIGGCLNVAPHVGITSTPVMDCRAYTVYVVAKTKHTQAGNTSYHYFLHALDLASGADLPGSPVDISASVLGSGQPNDGHGHVRFEPHWHMNRPGLLLLNGVVYVAFASHCDFHFGEYHGWVMTFNASTLAHLATFCTTPDSRAAGIWQGGMGLAADPRGYVYFTTGNGDFNANVPGGREYGDTVVKLDSSLNVADYFTPSDQPTLLAQDIDLGSGGVLVLPDVGHELPLLVTCGKDGNVLLINRNNMGRYTPGGPDHLVQFPPVQLRPGASITDQPGVWGGPAYYNTGQQQFVYYCGSGGHLAAYVLAGNALSLSHLGGAPNQAPHAAPNEGGATPNVSSNGETAGSAVVWMLTHSNPIRLWAFDATNLTSQLLDLDAGPWPNIDNGSPFIEPTVINGKVYVASDGQLRVFGL